LTLVVILPVVSSSTLVAALIFGALAEGTNSMGTFGVVELDLLSTVPGAGVAAGLGESIDFVEPFVSPGESVDLVEPFVSPGESVDLVVPFVSLVESLDLVEPFVALVGVGALGCIFTLDSFFALGQRLGKA
jgi:hypothetical protein